MKRFYKLDEKESEYILFRQNPEFDNLTCVQIAISENLMDFMSHESIQNALTEIWYGEIDGKTHVAKVGIIYVICFKYNLFCSL